MPRILGIDPGSQITGYGIIDARGSRLDYIDSGCIRLQQQDMPARLRIIYQSVAELVARHGPQEMAVERVFMHRNPDSALKLGQARGVAILAGVMAGLPVHEYAPRAIKQAVVGTGAAAKEQVQHMVCALLGLSKTPQADAADALAVALCHGHTLHTRSRLAQAGATKP